MSESCGHPTADDSTPCQNPTTDDGEAGRCWIDAHNDADTTSGNPGRPSELGEHRGEILDAARQGMTIEGCARAAGVDESTLHRWIQRHEDFAADFRRARAKGERKHLASVNDAGSRFVLERSYGYTKTEKRTVDASHDHQHDATERYAELVGAASKVDLDE